MTYLCWSKTRPSSRIRSTMTDSATPAQPPLIDPAHDPFQRFEAWMAEAAAREPNDPNAMALATAEVTILPGESETVDEGCLSFPGVRGHVDRVERVAVDFRDLTGAPHRLVATGLLARCIQHEHDHCQGVLFIDRMSPGHRMRAEPKIRRLLRETQASRRPG
jgi:peptide deformylase